MLYLWIITEDMGLDLIHLVVCHKPEKAYEYFTLDEFRDNPGFIERHKYLLTPVPDKTDPVFYFMEKGYQREGMNFQFYKDFENCKLYFDLETVEKAAGFLLPRAGESIDKLREQFKTDFIDNFVEGESIFLASW